MDEDYPANLMELENRFTKERFIPATWITTSTNSPSGSTGGTASGTANCFTVCYNRRWKLNPLLIKSWWAANQV